MTYTKQYTHNYCKIVATVGPIDGREDIIEKFFLAGARVFRMNLSHAPVAEHAVKVKIIREIEKKYNTPLGVIFDLQGPKLRVGVFKNDEVILQDGQKFTLDMDPTPGDETRVCLPHKEIYQAVSKGHILLFNDGLIRVRVDSVNAASLETTVINGGALSNRKGVNVPDVSLPLSALTEQDIANIKEAEGLDIDWFALSFVQKSQDLELAKSLIKSKAGIIAKIEKPQAIEHLDKIIELCDIIMVARGDLGVELNPEKVPVLQRRIVTACRRAGRPVIVATQMLESMIVHPTPTRAEASDIATAVYEGADAVMLSGETANGRYPVQAVETMSRVISAVEQDTNYKTVMEQCACSPALVEVPDAVTASAAMTANMVNTANIIVNFTETGITTLRTARQRPCLPIISLTPNIVVARKLAAVWGVRAHIVGNLKEFNDIEREVKKAAHELGFAAPGSQVVITAGVPFGIAGDTNLMYVLAL